MSVQKLVISFRDDLIINLASIRDGNGDAKFHLVFRLYKKFSIILSFVEPAIYTPVLSIIPHIKFIQEIYFLVYLIHFNKSQAHQLLIPSSVFLPPFAFRLKIGSSHSLPTFIQEFLDEVPDSCYWDCSVDLLTQLFF